MTEDYVKADLCVIGAGSGGLSVAAGAAQLGLKVILVEREKMGGDCLNTGCVPSKALLAAAKRAHMHRKDNIPGIKAHEPEINFSDIKDYVFDVIKTIAPNDSRERFENMGVTVIHETARFTSMDTVQAGKHIIRARFYVIATGAHAFIPPIPGLKEDRTYTNETIFDLRAKPDHLLVIGGGPVGIEMAQAHRRLGCRVSVFDSGPILPRDDQRNVKIIRRVLQEEGVDLYEHTTVKEIKYHGEDITVVTESSDDRQKITGSHLLAATGRVPNISGLDLDKAGVKYDKNGITIDQHLKTTNPKIFAIGDVSGGPQFTHWAGYQASVVIKQICFKMIWAKVNDKALPWVTYTDPELAQIGLTEDKARYKYADDIKVVEWPFHENDRAITERKAVGQIRVITDKKGYILGVSIIGPNAGELIGLWAVAITNGLKISSIASIVAPYPTLSEISKRVAGAWYTPSLFNDKTRRIVRLLQKLPL